jgi:protocatechuate 3,4-dioxygenase beta subunit
MSGVLLYLGSIWNNDIDREVDVGLFHHIHQKHAVPRPHHKALRGIRSLLRTCRFEQMEPRQLLSVTPSPIHVGATYFEDSNPTDTASTMWGTDIQVADLFEVKFNGGASGTQLTKLVIALNDASFFDTATGGAGSSGALQLTILNQQGFTLVDENGAKINTVTVADGADTLTLYFKDFTEDDKLVFSIDVDEADSSQVVEGREIVTRPGKLDGQPITIKGATLTATFVAPHMTQAKTSPIDFTHIEHGETDDKTKEFFTGSGLENSLPDVDYDNDAAKSYMPSVCVPGYVYTAGALGPLQQIPLPITLSGYVFEDINADNVQQSGEPGIKDVQLTLMELVNGSYVATNKITTTKADGSYKFEGLLPSTYRVVETQPNGYLSVGDTPGTVGGATRGVIETVDKLKDITLEGGDNSIHNDFAETLPAEISGHVYHDANNNGIRDFFGEDGIPNARLVVENMVTHVTHDAYTNPDGYWSVGGLMPGHYKVTEYQPDGYLDGLDAPGTAGGDAHNPGDLIDGVYLVSGQSGIDYDFGELKSGCISGYVYVDANNNGVFDAGETPISGATLTLLDGKGNATGETRVTDEKGFYRFCGLVPGAYAVQEAQPLGYFDGTDKEGSSGGFANNPGDLINKITLGSGVKATDYDFGELAPASLSGYVYYDANNNGTFDAGETPISGVTLTLLDAKGNSTGKTWATDENGFYHFDGLQPAVYAVRETPPARYDDGLDAPGSVGGTADNPGDLIHSISLGSGVKATNYNFGELLTIISGRVFQDGPTITYKEGDPVPDIFALRDGTWTPDDTPLAGITIVLCDGSGVPMQYEVSKDNWIDISTKTNSAGIYQFILNDFGLLGENAYTIKEMRPTEYTPGIDTVGTNDGKVFNTYIRPTAQEIQSYGIVFDPSGVYGFDPTGLKSAAITRINMQPGDNAKEYNFSEVLLKSESTPPDNPPPENPPHFPIPSPPPAYDPPLSPPVAIPGGQYPLGRMPYTFPQLVVPEMAGGSGGPGGYSWHLSIIDAGHPRRMGNSDRFTQYQQNSLFDPVSWSGAPLDQSQFILADENGAEIRTIRFGMTDATPVTGDWSGDGITKVGVFIDGLWFLDLDGNGVWDQGDLWSKLGKKGDQPVAGDWDGDGKTDIGIYGPAWIGDLKAISVEPGLPDAQNPPAKVRPKNVPPEPADAAVGWRTMKKGNAGQMRSDVIDHVFQYGSKGDRAVAGDWNGDGIRTVGIFRNGAWFLDMDGDGRWSDGDISVEFGQEGDLPVVGDWTGDGISKLGIYRNGTFYLDTNNNRRLDATDKVFQLGHSGDQPVAGDWTGNGVDKVGVYEQNASAKPQTASSSNAGAAATVK